jgi:hypothetical protein
MLPLDELAAPAFRDSLSTCGASRAAHEEARRARGQPARTRQRSLRDEIAARLDAAVPANTKETGRTLDLHALKPGVSRAAALVSYRSPRGKLGTLRVPLAQLSPAPRR